MQTWTITFIVTSIAEETYVHAVQRKALIILKRKFASHYSGDATTEILFFGLAIFNCWPRDR